MRKPRGFQNFGDAMMAGRAMAGSIKHAKDAPINATCDKCGGGLRCPPEILAVVRLGYVDHATCGGTYRVAASPGGEASEGER